MNNPTRRLLLSSTLLVATATCSQAAPAKNPLTVKVLPMIISNSTRALSQYRRDDAAPGQLTRVLLNAAHVAAQPVSPNVFGNFVENLGTVIYDTLWADALHNPNLEKIDAPDREPQWWDQTGAASWQESGGYLSPRCVRLSGPDGTLSQRVFLPAYGTRAYTLTLYGRAVGAAGQITAALRVGGEKDGGFQAGEEKAGAAVVSTSLPLAGTEWRKQTIHWNLPVNALAKGQAARLVFSHTGDGGAIDIDQISLFPDDAVDNFDPDTLKAAQAWHIPILRFAGNYSSGYHWRDGVGPPESRPTFRNVAWNGVDSHQFGTDEFLSLCRHLGATPQIGVNAGNGTAEEAAAWVHYCNDSSPTHKSGRVPVWEIGNELYGNWQIGHTDAPGNAARFVQFRDAMLKADPTIKILATGKGDEFRPDGVARDLQWNEAVLRAAVASGGQAPDYLSLHPLVPYGGLGNQPYADRFESAMSHPAFLDGTLLPQLTRLITDIEGPAARTRIAPTEWGIIVGGDHWQESPNHNAASGAIFNALTLNTFLRNGDWVTLANMTALFHGGCIKKSNGVVYVDPQYYTSQLYAAARPHTPIETVWTGPGRDVPQRDFLPAVPDVPDVDVFSALTADKSHLCVFLVNRTLSDTRPVHLDIAGFTATRASATLLTSSDPQATNAWDRPDAVSPQPFALSRPAASGKGWDMSLPPHALFVALFAHR